MAKYSFYLRRRNLQPVKKGIKKTDGLLPPVTEDDTMMSVIVGSQSEYPPSDTHRPDVGEHRVGFYFDHIGENTDMVEYL